VASNRTNQLGADIDDDQPDVGSPAHLLRREGGGSAATLTATLRVAAKAISVAWCQPFGWVRDESRMMTFVKKAGFTPVGTSPKPS
jgi:hypothetical protein